MQRVGRLANWLGSLGGRIQRMIDRMLGWRQDWLATIASLVLLVIVAFLFYAWPGPAAWGLSTLATGAVLYFTGATRVAPPWVVVPAWMLLVTSVLILGVSAVVALIGLTWPWPWFALWPLIFPIGLGIGIYTWGVLDPAAETELSGGASEAAALCVRFGLGLLWLMVAWALIVLNVNRWTDPWFIAVLVVMSAAGIAIALWIWHWNEFTGPSVQWYRRYVAGLLERRRKATADKNTLQGG